MRNQVKLTFYIGMSNADLKKHTEGWVMFRTNIIAHASRKCGGCTTSDRSGWWVADDDRRKEEFSGTVKHEHCFVLELTCEVRKCLTILNQMRNCISMNAIANELPIEWVHVTEQAIMGHHFHVDAPVQRKPQLKLVADNDNKELT